MQIEIAFYKGKGNWANAVVRWWTKSPYSHAELILPDGETWLGISPFINSKVSMRTKLEASHEEWDLIPIDVTKEQYDVILQFFAETEDCPYDWIGMLCSQFLPFIIKQKEHWYCSEWIAYALRISGVIDWKVIKIYDQCDLSPGRLYSIVMDHHDIIGER